MMIWMVNKWPGLFSVPWPLYAIAAYWRRRQGHYDKKTLACFYAAWKMSPKAFNLIAYLNYRRDIGQIANQRMLKPLIQSFSSLNDKSQRHVINWLFECCGNRVLDMLDTEVLKLHIRYSPPAAALHAKRAKSTTEIQQSLALIQNRQEQWREAFITYIKANHDKTCVVGNAASIVNSGLGGRIDSYPVGIRFNQYFAVMGKNKPNSSLMSTKHDTGSRTSIWVCAPNLHIAYPDGIDLIEWVVITGPDVRYRLADWSQFIPLIEAGKRVLTVPLPVWRTVVKELKAPPSAGILCLAWLVDILGTPKGIVATGFQRNKSLNVRYHSMLPRHNASKRHNWDGELALLHRWQIQGLKILD